MKKYAYAMAATVEDHDYPKRAAQQARRIRRCGLGSRKSRRPIRRHEGLERTSTSDRSFGAFGGMGFELGAGAVPP